MKSIALRFTDKFAPKTGTILEHKKILEKLNYVYWGKLGNVVSKKVIDEILNQENPKILLIHSANSKRFWAYIEDITREKPEYNEFPEYYHSDSDRFKTWFKIIKFEEAQSNIMSLCKVASSGAVLSNASKHSMSPYFIIDVKEQND